MQLSRRDFGKLCAAAGMLGAFPGRADDAAARRFHLCVSPEALDADPDLLRAVADSSVKTIWLTGFCYGYWPYPLEKVLDWKKKAEQAGLDVQIVDVPLGHPGDSLGAKSGDFPLTPPEHWRLAYRPDGSTYAGTSLHSPATEENVSAMRRLRDAGFRLAFVDDDFRLARGPGVIGGCFCDDHRKEFCALHGYGDKEWRELLEAVDKRSLTKVLRDWVDYTCGQLTKSFRAQQAAAGPSMRLGIMVMYLGAEKAGIRLDDYRNVPFRVGELMFNDAGFNPVKGKTDELFSALFHRRYAQPDLAYSETTAFPADQLSAANMAAKLTVSTIADVRNTMMMSGISTFPRGHWDVLKPAMRLQAELHQYVAGHAPKGPFKHFWGEPSRMAGDDKPYSLFLAMGVPFEVVEELPDNGWTFLSDADAAGGMKSPGSVLIARAPSSEGVRPVPEDLEALFAFKRELRPKLKKFPFVDEDKPAVLAWYPTAAKILLWNLGNAEDNFTIMHGKIQRTVTLPALGSMAIDWKNQYS